jgi:hypothetical protein
MYHTMSIRRTPPINLLRSIPSFTTEAQSHRENQLPGKDRSSGLKRFTPFSVSLCISGENAVVLTRAFVNTNQAEIDFIGS